MKRGIRSLLRAFLTLLVMSATAQAAPNEAAILAKTPPKLLSEFGLFDDLQAQKPTAGVTPFDLSTPLFSDGALKHRFVYLPAEKPATYVVDEAFQFPVGAVLIKTFAFPADFRAPDKDMRLIETRLLIHQESGWQAWAYVWNADQTDAELKIIGAKADIAVTDKSGAPLNFTYAVPNKNQCKACHSVNGELVPLGPKARNLNRELDYGNGLENQLAHWSASGMLQGAPAATDIQSVPHWLDAAQPLDGRARVWLDVNCAHCHRREGPASNSGLFLTYNEPAGPAIGIGKRPVAAGKGSGGREFDIAPGEPDNSILLFRVESTEPGVLMPELGRHVADPDAVALLRDWIASLR